jgi:hypothetical protein
MTMGKFSKSCTFLCANPPPISFISKVKKIDKVDGLNAEKTKLIRKLSLGFQVYLTLYFLQGWMNRGVDQLLNELMPFREIEYRMALKEQAEIISKFRRLYGQSIVLL